MSYGLPKSVEIDGQEFAIRYDYRVILDLLALNIGVVLSLAVLTLAFGRFY